MVFPYDQLAKLLVLALRILSSDTELIRIGETCSPVDLSIASERGSHKQNPGARAHT